MQAGAFEGTSISEFLRRAAKERAARTLGSDPGQRLSYAIGAIEAGRGFAKRTGAAFGQLVEEQHRGR